MNGKRARQIRKAGKQALQLLSENSEAFGIMQANSLTIKEVRRFKKDYTNKEPHTQPKVKDITKRGFRIAKGRHG